MLYPNYFFWLPVFGFLIWLNWLFLHFLEETKKTQRLQMLVVALLHALVLVMALASIEGALEQTVKPIWKYFFATLCFLLVTGFYFDLLLYRMMRIHLVKGARLLVENGLKQFVLTVESIGVSRRRLWQFAVRLAVLEVAGAGFVRLTERFSARWPFEWNVAHIAIVILFAVIIALAIEFIGRSNENGAQLWQEYRKIMPFYIGLSRARQAREYAGALLRPLRTKAQIERALEKVVITPGKRPDIFLFVIESLRADILDDVTAPNLAALRKDCLPFADSFSSGNATHLSWYSLFTGNFPLYFGMAKKRPELWGSVPLRLLKRMGYEIHVVAASLLNYHLFDQVVFGVNHELISSLMISCSPEKELPERDSDVTKLMLDYLNHPSGGRVFLIFYESPHHDYHWAKDYAAPFQPFAKSWDYTNWKISDEQIGLIRARYRNSVHYVDHLVGQIVEKLRQIGQYEEAIIFATGDHGEAFGEHGCLVHASNIYRAQTHVPFYLKLPQSAYLPCEGQPSLCTVAHSNFFPTLLDFLGTPATGLFDGESALSKPQTNIIVAAQDGGRDPREFCVIVEKLKAFFRYPDGNSPIAFENKIYLQKVTDANDQNLPLDISSHEGRQFVRETFGTGLRTLFPNINL